MKKQHSFLIIIVLSITSCNSEKEYPIDVAEDFMNSCMQSGATQEVCTCMFKKVQDKYTASEYSIMEAKVEEGQSPEEFVDFIKEAQLECE